MAFQEYRVARLGPEAAGCHLGLALAGGLLLCGWTLAGMSFPWMV